MNILLIVPTEYKSIHWGGVMTYTLHLAQELKALRHTVTILTPGTRTARRLDRGVVVYTAAYQKIHIPGNRILTRVLPITTDRIKWMLCVRRFVKKIGPFDIVESSEWGSSTLFVPRTCGSTIVRLHRSTRQYCQDNGLPISLDLQLINVVENFAIAAAGGVTSPSRYMVQTHIFLTKILSTKRTPIKIIHNGVPIPNYVPTHTPPRQFLLTVGRLEQGKGIATLIRAFTQVTTKFPAVHLYIIGRDTNAFLHNKWTSFQKYIQTEILKNNIQEKIHLIHQLSQAGLSPYYQGCLFYIMPSIGHENQPIALLDAMRWGKAAIGSSAGGIPEILRTTNSGLTCEENNAGDLARAIITLLQNTRLRKTFERNAIRSRHAYDLQNTTKDTVAFYKEIIMHS